MAKRTSDRSAADDTGAAAPAEPKLRRSKALAPPGSMRSEPSDEDIRLRAYHRYLERGGEHGMDTEDWLEAEKELKNQ
jgi:hypothetical protein